MRSPKSRWRRNEGRFRDVLVRVGLGAAVLALFTLTVAAQRTVAWFEDQAPTISDLDRRTPPCPSRVYGDPVRLSSGDEVTLEEFEAWLHEAGYRPVGSQEVGRGEYRVGRPPAEAPLVERAASGDVRVTVHLRPFPLAVAGGFRGGGLASVEFDDSRVASVSFDGGERASIALDPPRLVSYYDERVVDCRQVRVDQLPKHLVQAVMAAEDDDFFDHAGISVFGILRAAWVNFRSGEVRQGGSTITQQLIKNLYLDPTRSYERKVREAGLALLADRRYSKEDLLEAYLNWIYLGRSGSAQLVGVASAAQAYFRREPEELDLAQSALLAGMIQSPGRYQPIWNPEGSKARRDFVLQRMMELGWISEEQFGRATASPLDVVTEPLVPNRVGQFARFVEREARNRYGVELAATGHSVLATVKLSEQLRAQAAVSQRVAEMEPGSPLQAALVSLDPSDGAILAYVGGREASGGGFDRASQARRQVGSLYKPFVYAAGFQNGLLPGTRIEDSPLTLEVGDETWSPRNHSREYQGIVTARQALEQSLNVPAVRVAMATGLGRVARFADALGVAPDGRYPSMALGASTYSPLEMASAFGTLAATGVRAEPYSVQSVYDAGGEVVRDRVRPERKRVVDEVTAHLVTSVLRGVVDRGTGWRLRSMGLQDPLAGKTGTSNDTRDAWFAAYSPDRATVVWVGYDDNRPVGKVGGRAALPVFADFALAVRPKSGFERFEEEHEGLVWAEVDPTTGYLASDDCPERVREIFTLEREPTEPCPEHLKGWPLLSGQVLLSVAELPTLVQPKGAVSDTLPTGQ